MATSPDRVARELQASLGLLFRRLRQVRVVAELSQPESTALASLVRNAPATSADLARVEAISAQSMHATITALERRGFVRRIADAADGRRMLIELTDAGRAMAGRKRDARAEQFATALGEHFTAEERATLHAAAPLLERLAKAL
ncbi:MULTISPECIES: MarR family winged helix-turn-helix transcriptional regulator [unclassified Nocardioides]|uniref:MarR family winged helix-turn-helix transcriptional regulator n=1 Tax=unclassified Nocardioides TaxID=2615069 RepID=UPI001F3A69B6|nr:MULTISPECIES: MarR family transcriptional regulator [unclassified Nocardioides]